MAHTRGKSSPSQKGPRIAMSDQAGPNLGGAIHIHMGVSDGRVSVVDVQSTRPPDAARIFEGRQPLDVARMMGLVFSLCGRAQTICALGALEQAQGLAPGARATAARDVLRLAEMLSQTALRLCLDWPRLLDVLPRAEIARATLDAERALEQALFGGTDWRVPGGIAFVPDVDAANAQTQELTALLEAAVHDDLAPKLRAALSASGLDGFGATPGLADSDPLATDGIEDGALRRRWRDPAVRAARDRCGVGLRARLEARLADIRADLQQITRELEDVGTTEPQPQNARADGMGEARVETVRGPLRHRVTLSNGTVAAYDITAPTDANFAPGGVVATGLLNADGVDETALKRAAELFALAVDPCVACHLEIERTEP